MPLQGTLQVTMLHSYEDWMGGFWPFLDTKADFELAAAFSKLFWPDFIEVDGCVLLAEHYDRTSFQAWVEELNGEPQTLEAVINETHVYDLFNNSVGRTPAPAIFEWLGQVLLKTWACCLRECFPSKRFEFRYATEPYEYGPTLTFWHVE
jgi:hypothetical protein